MVEAEQDDIFLGFDFGLRRIGVAVGQPVTCSANPVTTLRARKGIPDWQEIGQLIKVWGATAFVVGIPYNMDSSEQPISRAARQFGHQLKFHFGLPVYWADERLTTREAKWDLAANKRLCRNLHQVDSFAAKLILESWLRSHPSYFDK